MGDSGWIGTNLNAHGDLGEGVKKKVVTARLKDGVLFPYS